MKTTPCTNGPRHKWQWLKNISIGSVSIGPNGSRGNFSLRGIYKCQCGAKKAGQFNPNSSDLRNITGATA